MTKNAEEIINEDGSLMTEEQVKKLENYQRLHWDVFYKNNKVNFYKDRHYIRYEFSDLVDAIENQKDKPEKEQFLLLDFGCGVGNGFYPLVEEFGYHNLRVNCCDLSKTAIQLVKSNEHYKEEHVDAKQCDLVND